MRIARWTIGPVTQAGFECLSLSIASFCLHHPDTQIVVCYNCPLNNLENLVGLFPHATLVNQAQYLEADIPPMGVAWKLYPTRLYPKDHELCIDNDIVFVKPLEEIERFYEGDHTLLLEGANRNYGQFAQHVPQPYCINSGVYGMPPHFRLQKYFDFYVKDEWKLNAFGRHAANKTFDEQGLVALALLSNPKFDIISAETLTNCEKQLIWGRALHFISLNRNQFHRPFRIFKSTLRKMFL